MKTINKRSSHKTGKVYSCFIACWMIFWSIVPANAQLSASFPTVFNPSGCADTYEIDIRISLDSVRITNIYFDNGTSGSFSFEAFFSYENTFTNSTLPPTSNFFTYDITIFSDNVNLNSPSLTNNVSNVPLQTSTAGGLASQNNPTYAGSASALGLVLNGAYSSPAFLSQLGYDSGTLHINLPCLDTVMGTNQLTPFVLPVLWSGITAAVNGNEVSLTWQTFIEQNNLGFTIERSLDGSNWQPVGFIHSKAAGGNSDEPLSYLYKQTEQYGARCFYRVVQRDIDGTSKMSNTVRVVIAGQQDLGNLVVYPNPSADILYMKQVPPGVKYIISDSYGRIVLQGYYHDRIDISKLSPGVYWIRAETMVSRFVVMKGP